MITGSVFGLEATVFTFSVYPNINQFWLPVGPHHAWERETFSYFFIFLSAPTWGRTFWPPILLMLHLCPYSHDSYRIQYKNQIFGSFIWHFYLAL